MHPWQFAYDGTCTVRAPPYGSGVTAQDAAPFAQLVVLDQINLLNNLLLMLMFFYTNANTSICYVNNRGVAFLGLNKVNAVRGSR